MDERLVAGFPYNTLNADTYGIDAQLDKTFEHYSFPNSRHVI